MARPRVERQPRRRTARPRTAVIIGASVAGVHAAEGMRKHGFDGRIVMVGAETHLPYDKPPLSKSVLTGLVALESTSLRPPAFFEDADIELQLGQPATALDLRSRSVTVGTRPIEFDALVIATGSRARPLGQTRPLRNVFTLRSRDDAASIRDCLEGAPRVVVLGGGFIGGEVAASARRRGLEVTIIDIATRPMVGAFGESLARDYMQLHQDNGVRLLGGTGIAAIHGSGQIEEIELTDGRRIPADLLVVGIGTTPCIEWLADSGLDIDDGIACDSTLNTGVDGVYVAGDVARYRSAAMGIELRSAHWKDATQQGLVAGANAVSDSAKQEYRDVPYFWSTLYGCRIQVTGVVNRTERPPVLIGPDGISGLGGTIALWQSPDDVEAVEGICAWNATSAFNRLKKWFCERRESTASTPLTGALAIAQGG